MNRAEAEKADMSTTKTHFTFRPAMLPLKPPNAAPEATEAATAAPRRITRTPTHGYAATREDAMAAFAKSWRRQTIRPVIS